MYTVYLALILFGNNQACHAEVKCPAESTQCQVKVRSCDMTLEQCLNSSVVTAFGRFETLGCSNKPNP